MGKKLPASPKPEVSLRHPDPLPPGARQRQMENDISSSLADVMGPEEEDDPDAAWLEIGCE